jgi:hypothetical protein
MCWEQLAGLAGEAAGPGVPDGAIAAAIWAPGSAVTLDAFAGDGDDHPQDQDEAEEQADVAEHVEQ